jgi:ABC-2 type transport system ATP-binding protein
VLAKHQSNVLQIENPKATLEELFLNIVRESEQHPGRRSADNQD